jgi:hypothetical protein
MKVDIHPAVFVAGAIALSATWLWLRSLQEIPVAEALAQQARTDSSTARAAPRPSVHVDAAVLERYAGKYEIGGLIVTLSVAQDRLVGDASEAGRFELLPASDTKFYFGHFPGEVTFDVDGGRAKVFFADLPAGRVTAKRVLD